MNENREAWPYVDADGSKHFLPKNERRYSTGDPNLTPGQRANTVLQLINAVGDGDNSETWFRLIAGEIRDAEKFLRARIAELEAPLSSLQQETGLWASSAFPAATDATICAHLAEEVSELESLTPNADPFKRSMEAADVLLILLHYCHRHRIDLQEAARKKLAICRTRTWARDEARGYDRHVETSSEEPR